MCGTVRIMIKSESKNIMRKVKSRGKILLNGGISRSRIYDKKQKEVTITEGILILKL